MFGMKHLKYFYGLTGVAVGLALAPMPTLAAEKDSALDVARQLNNAFIEVAEKVSPFVVVIQVWHKASYLDAEEEGNPSFDLIPRQFRRQFEQERERERQSRSQRPNQRPPDGQGSGIVIREDGYILTNRHVVDGAERVRVRLKNGKIYDAEIKGVDSQSDIAVIKIEAKNLSAAKMGDSAQTRVGEFAIAIGAPFELDYSVTYGHVSAKGRSNVILSQTMDQDFVQTDASINPGNSGGPLVNLSGEVIGVNTLIRGLHTGIGFAIPVNLAKEVSDKLISEGKYRRAWLGIEARALKDDMDYQTMLPEDTDGVIVVGIQPNAPAAKSDLKLGDVITKVGGRPVTTVTQLKAAVRSQKIGEQVTVDVFRDGKNIKVKVKTEEWLDKSGPVETKLEKPHEADAESLGLSVQTLSRDLAEQFNLEVTQGALVTALERNSLAERKGIRTGDVITEVDDKPVSSAKQFKEAIRNANLKKGIRINLVSNGVSRFVVLKDSGD